MGLHELGCRKSSDSPDSGFVEYFCLATANKRHEATRAGSCDCETCGRDSGMADRTREDFARCVSRRLGESQSKDVKTDDLQSGWHSKCWRGAFLHSWMFASVLVRFAGLCLIVRPRNPRLIPIWAVSVACTTSDVRGFFVPFVQNPLQKAQHLKVRTQYGPCCMLFSVDVAFSVFHACSDVSVVGIGLSVFPHFS